MCIYTRTDFPLKIMIKIKASVRPLMWHGCAPSPTLERMGLLLSSWLKLARRLTKLFYLSP